MKKNLIIAIFFIALSPLIAQNEQKQANKNLSVLFENYYEEGLKLFPLKATAAGDNRYNHLLYADFTDSYRARIKEYYNRYLKELSKYKLESLNKDDQLSYKILKNNLEMSLAGLALKDNRMPLNQMNALPLYMAQLGSGSVVQPFKTVEDYDNWIKRASAFPIWVDSAIVYFRKGINEGVVLPKSLVVKVIPQMEDLMVNDPSKNVFYGPLSKIPEDFSEEDKKRLKNQLGKLINEKIIPSYSKLTVFLKDEYLPKSRTTSGFKNLPNGEKMYNYYLKSYTTTNKSADELYTIGIAEVKRIQGEMEKIKTSLDFKGDLKALFEYLKTDPKFFPFKTAEEVLEAYRAVQKKIDPNLGKLFNTAPKTPFVIKQTEEFRAASTPPQYFQGSLEKNRPGIFYVPIVDPTKTSIDEAVFLHEAIPGHHYQIALQQENQSLPKFRRFGSSGAYVEGWGLYSESLGEELGCYTDPYQKLKALSWEIHRAIRLVVDAGLHAKGWKREEAIKYMMDNEPISEQFTITEIERYMAMPGQAHSYKVGELKIHELRKKYSKQLGSTFKLTEFHHELLKDGAMPLNILEEKMDEWAKRELQSK